MKSGERLAADIVILGAGVAPKTDYLKTSGITLDRDGGITVADGMAIPNVANVYAVGDLARYRYHLTDEMVRVEHWNVAQNQGRLVAKNVIAKASGSESISQFVQVCMMYWLIGTTDSLFLVLLFSRLTFLRTVLFGKSIRYTGHAETFDDVIVQASIILSHQRDLLKWTNLVVV